ncbi:uncharacterized protein LOC115221331 isoform X2 [Octopus sinensis]|uniref:Uncharacterized protein LOC115221331 isoform X2 n=1 Tax=Octopus sinensis TaxID=2607531 RepID=A0A7E6FIG8_9MOLL|nr:uncharacterized protein LOC115221331 isoform X2 [Octopus sinensis]
MVCLISPGGICSVTTEIYSDLKTQRNALMTALAMICPEDPYLFIINKLLHIKEQGLQSVHWDMFLDETIKSRRALYKCRFEFSFEDDEDENV